jgi:uncharacterized RDD family membrane protein YckC
MARTRAQVPFALRCGAFLIDYIVLVLLVVLGTLFARMLGGGARAAGNSAETAAIVLAIVVALLNLGVTGMTLGKWATGLRIQRTETGNPGIGRALLRHFVGYPLSLATFGIGFLLVAVSVHGRGLHDMIAGTVVVREGSV